MMRTILIILLLLVSNAQAEILHDSIELISATGRTATLNGSVVDLPGEARITDLNGAACRAVATNNSGTTPTLDITVYTCTDSAGVDCDTLCAFTQCTTGDCWTDGSSSIDLGTTTNLYRYLKASATIGGVSPNYDVSVKIYFNANN